jgi:hypothetical protein
MTIDEQQRPEAMNEVSAKGPKFKVVIVYEDFSTGVRAKATMDRVMERLGEGAPFEIKLWWFDILDTPEFRGMAAEDAADADMVIVSAHGRAALPEGLKEWMELWLIRREAGECALVELFNSQSDRAQSRPIHSYLQDIAQKARFVLFSHGVGLRAEEPVLERVWTVREFAPAEFA